MLLFFTFFACISPQPTLSVTTDGLEVRSLGDRGPLVVAVHGYGESPEAVLASLQWASRSARVVVPSGPTPVRSGRSWFAIDKDHAPDEPLFATNDLVEASDRIAALIRERRDGNEVILTGVSQGGMITLTVALRHPELVDFAIPIAAMVPSELLPDAPAPQDAPPIRALHGDSDTLIPIGPTRAAIQTLAERGWDATLTIAPGIEHGPARELLAQRDAEIERRIGN